MYLRKIIMPIKYLFILTVFIGNIFSNSNNFSDIIILSSSNVHGEVDPCG